MIDCVFLDEEAQEEPREEADECVHEVVSAREAEDHRDEPRRSQCRDLEEPREEVAHPRRRGETAFH